MCSAVDHGTFIEGFPKEQIQELFGGADKNRFTTTFLVNCALGLRI